MSEEQEELTKNIAQMVLEHRGKVSYTDQIIPHETDLYTVLDAIRAILSEYTFFSHKGLLIYKMLSLSPVDTTGLSLKPMRWYFLNFGNKAKRQNDFL